MFHVHATLLAALLLASAGLVAPAVVANPADAIHRLHHDVTVEPGVTLRVVEAWSDAGAAREDRRAVLMISPTLVTHEVWDADVPGDPSFSGLTLAARRGYHAYAFDHWGYGDSSKPANGMDVTAEKMLAHTAVVLEWARARSGAEKVDLVAGSLGNSIAIALGGVASPVRTAHVGAIVATANVYSTASPVLSLTVLSPAVCSVLPAPPDGYTVTVAPVYALVLWNAEPEAQAWGYQAFPGTYAQGPTQEGCDLPVFPVEEGRAPIMVAYGPNDVMSEPSDIEAFADAYGGPVRLAYYEGGGHSPFFESVRHDFWRDAFAWLDRWS